MIRPLSLRLVPARATDTSPAPTPPPVKSAGTARTALPHGSAPARRSTAARDTARAWSELLRVSALPSVPGDALAGAAAAGLRPGRGTVWAVGSSLCLYEAGMALNDWADRHEDAVERPHRPLPSGRVRPGAALGAAGLLTATGLALAARAGRPALTVATALAATVWAYDLRLKHTAAGPAAMATARGLDLLLGATATASGNRSGTPGTARPNGVIAGGTTTGGARRASGPRDAVATTAAEAAATAMAAAGDFRRPAGPRTAVPAALSAAAALATHTYAVTTVSRNEVHGGSTTAPLAALAATAALAVLTAAPGPAPYRPGTREEPPSAPHRAPGRATAERVTFLLATAYFRTAARPLLHAALNPSPFLTRQAVGEGVRAMIPLQAALMARSGAAAGGLALLGLAPLARRLARKVSPT
ncbi:prenyltransferase [Streptomyces populi]|uniref:Prenyltransferase n=1 Tax=Streptomyces populi TaxID=2058924 RepID=A0A2I0SN48_9ACTN|nr:UbiA family prenyltransferase [Streptomyces populi]PKT71358.1 prenyltransferase [Streptomyces populi]